MTKTYRQFMDEISYDLNKDNDKVKTHINMQIPHPNGKVYLIVEKLYKEFFNSKWACFEASKENGEWVMKPISKDYCDRDCVENALFDLSIKFQDLLPKD